MRPPSSILFFFNLVLLSCCAKALTESSPIVGYTRQPIAGSGATTQVGISLANPAQYEGFITAASAGTLTVGTDLEEILDPARHYYIEVSDNGPNLPGAHAPISDWDGDTLHLVHELQTPVTPGITRIRIIPMSTVAEIFGDDGDVLEGGGSSTADVVTIAGADGQLRRLYYSRGGLGGTGWRKVGSAEAMDDLPVYFTEGFQILKRSAGNGVLFSSGVVRMNPVPIIIPQGNTIVSVPFPGGNTLGNSGFVDPDAPALSLSGGSSSTADLVLMEANGTIERFYYAAGGFGGTGWRRIGSQQDQASAPVTSGLAITNRGFAKEIVLWPAY